MSDWNPTIPSAVYQALPTLKDSGVRVALVLARYANSDGECWPSQRTIAEAAGLSERGVRFGIADLKAHHLITVEPGAGRTITSRYAWKRGKPTATIKGKGGSPVPPKGGSPLPTKKPNISNPSTQDAERLLSAYADQVKPRSIDRSGSRKTFAATARKLLKSHPLADLLKAIDHYASLEVDQPKKFRKGFQSFFGPKQELYRDFLPGNYAPPTDPIQQELEATVEANLATIDAIEDEIAEEDDHDSTDRRTA